MNYFKIICTGFFVFLCTNISHATEKERLSHESVPILLKKGTIQCQEAKEKHEFEPAQPSRVILLASSIFDRTLRMEKTFDPSFDLPATVHCADLEQDLKKIPEELFAERDVYRVVEKRLFDNQMMSSLVGQVTIEIPVQVGGKNIALRADQWRWIEESPITAQSFPKMSFYVVLTHPQTFVCTPHYSGEYQLSLGSISGSSPSEISNQNQVFRTFASQKECEESRSEWLSRYAAEDPQNWGTATRVTRKLESVFRHILDNSANSMCQEIQLETVSVMIQGLRFMSVQSSFPIRTVSLERCTESSLIQKHAED